MSKNETSKRKPRISAVIITFMEEKNIPGLLESISWADEIILVDSGSTDSTVKIAKEKGAKIYKSAWKGYVDQKNRAKDKASNEWVLSIDADERITDELKNEILNTVSSPGAKKGYYIPRKTNFLGRWIKHCHWYPDWQLRLFKKDSAVWTGDKVHESVKVDGEVGYLTNPMLHFTYENIADQIDRLNRYSDLVAQAAFEKGKKAGMLQLLFAPLFTFLNIYIVRLGFLDGFAGLVIARGLAYYAFQKRAKLRQLYREKKNES